MTKEQLEEKKLELEVKKLSIPWYTNIEFWKVFIPTIAVLASLYFTFGRGLIDSEKSKLEIQKEQLKLDISRFEIKSESLSTAIISKDSVKNSLQKQIVDYGSQKEELIKEIFVLKRKLGKTDSEIGKINSERTKDKKFYQDKLLTEYNNEKTRLQELENLKSELNQKDAIIASQNSEIEFITPKVKLTEIEKNDLQIRKLDASSKQLEKQANSYRKSFQQLNEKYNLEKNRINNMTADELIREFELKMLKYENDEKHH